MLRLQCFMAFSVLSDKTSLNSLACNTRTFGKLSLNVRLNIISIFVKNMQNILWGKCQENTINFLKFVFYECIYTDKNGAQYYFGNKNLTK